MRDPRRWLTARSNESPSRPVNDIPAEPYLEGASPALCCFLSGVLACRALHLLMAGELLSAFGLAIVAIIPGVIGTTET